MQIPNILLQIYYYNIMRKKLGDDDEPRGSLLSFVIEEKPAQDDEEPRGSSLFCAIQ
jgi:hypothetical protein